VRVNAICQETSDGDEESRDNWGAVLAKKMGVKEEEQLAGIFFEPAVEGRAQTAAENCTRLCLVSLLRSIKGDDRPVHQRRGGGDWRVAFTEQATSSYSIARTMMG